MLGSPFGWAFPSSTPLPRSTSRAFHCFHFVIILSLAKQMSELPFFCRDRQVQSLDLFLKSGWPSLTVYGQKGTGKSCVVKSVLKKSQFAFSWISLAQNTQLAQMFCEILMDLSPDTDRTDCLCSTQADFLAKLCQISEQRNIERFVIVFDDLHSDSENTLAFFNRLGDIVKKVVTLSVITITTLLPGVLGRGSSSAIHVEFPSYSEEELKTILSTRVPEGYSDAFYKK